MLTPELVCEWISPFTSSQCAEEIVRTDCRVAGDFKWHAVRKKVGNIRNRRAELI
ncbi:MULTISPECIES: hypothetical protein [Pseudomonas]|uniref:hypothetical protein n=1 Tax=Pseudomonas TaxID=286 RepID=UPI001ED947C9|nr:MULTISPECIES: hypothetical protein [Pseudomonas]MDI3370636.1 hypothetical protein [Pseudomonas sp. V104_10]